MQLPCQDCGKPTSVGNGKWGRCDRCFDPALIEIYRIEAGRTK